MKRARPKRKAEKRQDWKGIRRSGGPGSGGPGVRGSGGAGGRGGGGVAWGGGGGLRERNLQESGLQMLPHGFFWGIFCDSLLLNLSYKIT